MKKILILEDGLSFTGEGFGSDDNAYGEVVFTTSMTGYQELLTDPSFLGQMVVMTFPMIGNYGINRYDYEAIRPHMSALIVNEACDVPSNFRCEKTLDAYLKKFNVPGISGIDTRALTRAIRERGTVRGVIVSEEIGYQKGLEMLKDYVPYKNHIERVSTKNIYEVPGQGKRVVLYDFGMKGSILKNLSQMGFNVTVVPYNFKASDALDLNPHGIFLSNGPGDPMDIPESIETVKELLGKVPVFGICMGHQVLSLACGAKTKKMGFGHRGANNPVRDLRSGKILITSQNHGYVVDEESLKGTGLEIIYKCVNDGTVEGVEHKELRAKSVQFHPESSPGPNDARVIFNEFKTLMEGK